MLSRSKNSQQWKRRSMRGCALPPMNSKIRIRLWDATNKKAWQCQWKMKRTLRNAATVAGIAPRSEDCSSQTACCKLSKKTCFCGRVFHLKEHRLWRLSRNWTKVARSTSSLLKTVWWTTLRRQKYSVSCNSCKTKRRMQQRRTGLLMSHVC